MIRALIPLFHQVLCRFMAVSWPFHGRFVAVSSPFHRQAKDQTPAWSQFPENNLFFVISQPDTMKQDLKNSVVPLSEGHLVTCCLVCAFCTTSLPTLIRGVRMARVKSVTLMPCR